MILDDSEIESDKTIQGEARGAGTVNRGTRQKLRQKRQSAVKRHEIELELVIDSNIYNT